MRAVPRPGSVAGTLALGLGLAVLPTAPAHAAPASLPCFDTAGLRHAITDANAAGSGDIVLGAGCRYIVSDIDNENSGLPKITGNVRITSPGSASIERSAANGTPEFRMFTVAPGGRLTLEEVDVVNGYAPGGGGGAVFNKGSLVVIGSDLRGNYGALGGALDNETGATARLDRATISDNLALDGGGIFNNGQLSLDHSTVHRNKAVRSAGGGIYNAGRTTITAGQVTGNTAASGGGGIYTASGQVSISDTLITSNTPDNCEPADTITGCTN